MQYAEGELPLVGPQAFSGYVDAWLDADAFDERGFFRTGDLGFVDSDGYVRVTGRIKDIVIRNGENISTLEVEGILARHPAIADLALVALPDERTGERRCAVVVLRDNVTLMSLADVARHCEPYSLACCKIPEQLELVEHLPRNAMGKVVKSELRTQFSAGVRR